MVEEQAVTPTCLLTLIGTSFDVVRGSSLWIASNCRLWLTCGFSLLFLVRAPRM